MANETKKFEDDDTGCERCSGVSINGVHLVRHAHVEDLERRVAALEALVAGMGLQSREAPAVVSSWCFRCGADVPAGHAHADPSKEPRRGRPPAAAVIITTGGPGGPRVEGLSVGAAEIDTAGASTSSRASWSACTPGVPARAGWCTDPRARPRAPPAA